MRSLLLARRCYQSYRTAAEVTIQERTKGGRAPTHEGVFSPPICLASPFRQSPVPNRISWSESATLLAHTNWTQHTHCLDHDDSGSVVLATVVEVYCALVVWSTRWFEYGSRARLERCVKGLLCGGFVLGVRVLLIRFGVRGGIRDVIVMGPD